MAIDRNITININDTSPLANTAYVDAGKENKVYNKAQVNELVEDLREGTLGSVSPSQTLQQLNALPDGNYYASEAGTYAFGTNVPVGWQFRFNKTGTTWKVLTKVQIPMQDLTALENRTKALEDRIEPNGNVTVGQTTRAVNGDKVERYVQRNSFVDFKHSFADKDGYEVNSKVFVDNKFWISTTDGNKDYPSGQSTKWEEIKLSADVDQKFNENSKNPIANDVVTKRTSLLERLEDEATVEKGSVIVKKGTSELDVFFFNYKNAKPINSSNNDSTLNNYISYKSIPIEVNYKEIELTINHNTSNIPFVIGKKKIDSQWEVISTGNLGIKTITFLAEKYSEFSFNTYYPSTATEIKIKLSNFNSNFDKNFLYNKVSKSDDFRLFNVYQKNSKKGFELNGYIFDVTKKKLEGNPMFTTLVQSCNIGDVISYSTNFRVVHIAENGNVTKISPDNTLVNDSFTATSKGYVFNSIRLIDDFFGNLVKRGFEILKGKVVDGNGIISDSNIYDVIKLTYRGIVDRLTIKTSINHVNTPYMVVKDLSTGLFKKYNNTSLNYIGEFSDYIDADIYINTNNIENFTLRNLTVDSELKLFPYLDNGNYAFMNNQIIEMYFNDEFDGNKLDELKWRYRTGEKSNGNNIKEAISVENSLMKIRLSTNNPKTYIQDENGINTNVLSNKSFTGGGIISKVDGIQYGYFEARIKMPTSNYMHSSFWTTQEFIQSNESTLTRNEIDIVEFDYIAGVGNNEMKSCIHKWYPSHIYATPFSLNKNINGNELPDFSLDFNNYGCLVTKEYVAFYFNGILMHRYFYKSTLEGYSINPCDIMLSSLPYTSPNLNGKTEDFMQVDWVRYYKSFNF